MLQRSIKRDMGKYCKVPKCVSHIPKLPKYKHKYSVSTLHPTLF